MTKTKITVCAVVTVAVASIATAQPAPARRAPSAAPFAVPAPPVVPQLPEPFVVEPPLPAPVIPPLPPEPPMALLPNDFSIDFSGLDQSLAGLKNSLKDMTFDLRAQQKGVFVGPVPQPFGQGRAQDEAVYDQARSMIERDQYDRALPMLDRVIDAKGTRVDAAMYWKAYSLSKLARRQEALTVIADLQKQFPNGAWTRDARALDVEIRQASGQSVSADVADDEVKLLALRGIMQNDPETGVPIIEKMLQGNSSVRVKDRALFVLSQSRTPRARDVLVNVATNGSNPDLKASAVKYLGLRSDPESLKVLSDIYASTNDVEMKRTILRSFVAANARDRLFAAAKNEKSPDLRAFAISQLGAVRGSAELEELYRAETDKDVKQRILQAFIAANAVDKLAAIARTEKDPDLQVRAIRNLGATGRPEAADALKAIYMSDVPIETKKAVIDGLFMHQNCGVLVGLARNEKNQELQTDIVRKLSTTTNRCPEARDYMLEILNK